MLSPALQKRLKQFTESTDINAGDICKFINEKDDITTHLYVKRLNADFSEMINVPIYDASFIPYGRSYQDCYEYINKTDIYIYIKSMIEKFDSHTECNHIIMFDSKFYKITNKDFSLLRKVTK